MAKTEVQSIVLAPTPARRERRRAETHERIFRAALKLFAERGVASTTVEDITEAADVGKGTFFNYFPSKEHVLAAFGAMQAAKAQAVFADAGPDEPLANVFRRLVRALAEEPGQSPALVRSLVGAFLSSEKVRQLMRRNLARALRFQTAAIAAAQQRGHIRSDQPAVLIARYLLQNWFGTLVLWTLFPSEPLNQRLEQMVEMMLAGMEPRQP